MRTPGTERPGELVASLKQFLNAQSATPTKTAHCAECGSVLRYLPMQFWLEGCEQSWNIPLPYCADCNPLPLSGETFIC